MVEFYVFLFSPYIQYTIIYQPLLISTSKTTHIILSIKTRTTQFISIISDLYSCIILLVTCPPSAVLSSRCPSIPQSYLLKHRTHLATLLIRNSTSRLILYVSLLGYSAQLFSQTIIRSCCECLLKDVVNIQIRRLWVKQFILHSLCGIHPISWRQRQISWKNAILKTLI